jgi:WD40 repeat protein
MRVIRPETMTNAGREPAHRWRERSHSVFETVTMRGYRRGGFRRCAFTPDGARIVSLTAEQQIRIWDARTGNEVQAPAKPETVVNHSPLVRKFTAMLNVGLHGRSGSYFETFAISPDGSRIAGAASPTAAAGYERWGGIGVWDLASCEEMLALRTGAGYRTGVVSCVFSPGGRLLAGGSQDGRITIWDAMSGQTVGVVWADGEVEALAWSPVEDVIAAGDTRGVVRILRLENVAPSPLVAVGWRRPRALAFFRRPRDGAGAVGCPACHEWSAATPAEPGALLPCPRCGTPLRLAPFVVEEDWEPVATAWRRDVS